MVFHEPVMGFDDIYRLSASQHLHHQSDLEEQRYKQRNLRKGLGGNRHGAYVQAIAARRESVASRRRVDHLDLR